MNNNSKLAYFVLFLLLFVCLSNINSQHDNTKLSKEQFDNGIKFLIGYNLILTVHYTSPITKKEITEMIKKQEDMVKFIRRKVPGKFYLLNQKTDSELFITEVKDSGSDNFLLGYSIWKIICDSTSANGFIKEIDCTTFFNFK